MNGITLLDRMEITLRDFKTGEKFPVYIDIHDNSLSRKWLAALNHLLNNNYHLEKNYCFFGFADGDRNGELLIKEINRVIDYINDSSIDYEINDAFTLENSINLVDEVGDGKEGLKLYHDHFNKLHRYFEELQGTAQGLSRHFLNATDKQRWYIRQVNLLCHEFESWALSNRQKVNAPDWQRPSQLMCWINAPRFELEEQDFELFGVDTLLRPTGGVYVGVNKAVGKHHWEVFQDEGKDSRVDELTTTAMRGQTLAAGDFDIEWAQDTTGHPWMKQNIVDFKEWLIANNFDPEDKTLTIGHPQVGQVNLDKTFWTTNHLDIWNTLYKYLDVYSVKTHDAYCEFDYHWSDKDFVQRQVEAIGKH